MTNEIIYRPDITNKTELDQELIKFSKANPTRIITYDVCFGGVTFEISDSQPRTGTLCNENCYRQRGGFYKNGQIIPPTNTWLKKFNFCPTMR